MGGVDDAMDATASYDRVSHIAASDANGAGRGVGGEGEKESVVLGELADLKQEVRGGNERAAAMQSYGPVP